METEEDLLNADKLLFAIDLVDYVIVRTRPGFCEETANILARADHLRNFTYNRFSKTIRKALKVIDVNQDNSVFNDFAKMIDEKRVNKESFIEYANHYRESIFSDDFNAKLFLLYCDRIANMAGYFLSLGVEDAPDIAVELIMQAFPQSIMYHDTWSTITKIAETFEVLGDDYYKGGMSSDSSSESIDQISSENEDSASDSINMDVNVSSPDDSSQSNLENNSPILKRALGIRNIKNSSFRYIDNGFEESMNVQSSDSACSSAVSSLSKFSSNNASLASIEDMSKYGS